MSHERRIFIDQELRPGAELSLSADLRHYLVTVLRLKEGSVITAVSSESNQAYEALISQTEPEARIKVIQQVVSARQQSRARSLAVALLKGSHNDFVCEKATELGVDTIIFWQAARSVVTLADKASANKKHARWQKIATAAAQQAGRNRQPEIVVVKGIRELIDLYRTIRDPEDRLMSCMLRPDAKEIRHLTPVTGRAHLLIGPEGDFTEDEESALLTEGFEAVSLGPNRLRAETAAICAVCMLDGAWGYDEMSGL